MSTLIEARTGTSSEEVRALRDRFVPKGLHVGTPVSKNPAGTCGALSAYTDEGPPDRITALGARARISSAVMV